MELLVYRFMDEYGGIAFGTVAALILMAAIYAIFSRLWDKVVSPTINALATNGQQAENASREIHLGAQALERAAESNAKAAEQARSMVAEQAEVTDNMRELWNDIRLHHKETQE